MKVSLRIAILISSLAVGLATPCLAQTPQPTGSDRTTSTEGQAPTFDLEREIQRLLPTLMSSLAAARRERDPLLIRCFDRAVSELHGVRRQVGYHLARHAIASEAAERSRHEKALRFLRERVVALSQRSESCFTEGVWVKPGETHVEVIVASHAR